MKSWLEALDRILRGEAARLSELREGLGNLPVQGLTILIALMGATYGICMGCFAIFQES